MRPPRGKHQTSQAIRKPGTLKYGFGVNLEQEITRDFGFFMRLGWNDGKTEGLRLHRHRPPRSALAALRSPATRLASGRQTPSQLPSLRRAYRACMRSTWSVSGSGLSHRGRQTQLRARIRLGKLLSRANREGLRRHVSFDAQHYANPAYNHDRGPVWAYSLRLHIEGKGGFPMKVAEPRQAGPQRPRHPALHTWKVMRYRLLALFAIIGPGFITRQRG